MSRAKERTGERERVRGRVNVEASVNQLGRYFQTIRLIVKPLDVVNDDNDDVRGYFSGIKENYLGIAFDFDDKSHRGRQFLRQLRAQVEILRKFYLARFMFLQNPSKVKRNLYS